MSRRLRPADPVGFAVVDHHGLTRADCPTAGDAVDAAHRRCMRADVAGDTPPVVFVEAIYASGC